MAPNPKKMAEACKAVNFLEIPVDIVKKKLRELLKLYDNNWDLIASEGYRVLADHLLEDNEQDEKPKKHKAPFRDEPQAPKSTKHKTPFHHEPQALESTKSLHSKPPRCQKGNDSDSARHSKSRAKTSLKGKLVDDTILPSASEMELTSSQPLCLTYTRSKRKASTPWPYSSPVQLPEISLGGEGRDAAAFPSHIQILSELEEFETPLKKLRQRNKKRGSDSLPPKETEAKISLRKGKSVLPSNSDTSLSSEEIPLIRKRSKYHEKQLSARNNESAYEEVAKPDLQAVCYMVPKIEPCMDIIPSEVILDSDTYLYMDNVPEKAITYQLEDQADLEAPTPGSGSLLLENSSTRNMDTNADPVQLLESRPFEVAEKEMENNYNSPSDLVQADVASTSKGEVRLSLICQSSQLSGFHAPDLDEVLKVVEDECKNSYGITKPEFSLMKIMREICERFMWMGTRSDKNELTTSICLHPGLYSSTTHDVTDLKEIMDDGDGCELNCPISPLFGNGTLRTQNLIVTVPQLLKHIPLSGFAGLHCVEGFNIGKNVCVATDQKFRLVAHPLLSKPLGGKVGFHPDALKFYRDISKGEEQVKISLVNDCSVDEPVFSYIPKSIIYDKANVRFTLAQISGEDCCLQCSEDCLTSATHCMCAQKTGGEFAYSPEGLVKESFLEECMSLYKGPEEYCYFYCRNCPLQRLKKNASNSCNGHVARKFIKECWSKCGCSRQCGNRVVQRGITRNLQVFRTPEGKGWGLRTAEDLPRGTFVCEYAGEILTHCELQELNMERSGHQKHMHVLLDAGWSSYSFLKDEEALALDAHDYGNVARFINHRCSDATLIGIPVEVESPDRHYYHLAFFTTRAVAAMEELTWDYGIDFSDKNQATEAFICLCGSSFCRGTKLRKK
ncbi:hypothetical protein Tsubulata_009502 [Turnera subulata]|uniref:SET domain-containing protein n=1 Tax=Turnera subulata TaxID=218843 RepID=A0A9Q0J549_9ROSI|nr:hypothetical protein Tsubulata_009502 [Turnera subulata]